jgi:hypothetical protein
LDNLFFGILLEDILKVSHGVSNIVLPLPNPPLRKVRGLDSP